MTCIDAYSHDAVTALHSNLYGKSWPLFLYPDWWDLGGAQKHLQYMMVRNAILEGGVVHPSIQIVFPEQTTETVPHSVSP
jgi:hypothetical protein